MPLPARVDYALPASLRATLAAGPSGRHVAPLDPARAVLLVHDMQRYFLRAFADDCAAYRGAVTATARLLDAARGAGVPVVYTAQPGDQHPDDRGLMTQVWGPGITAAADDVDVVAELAPRDGDVVLVKHRYSAFVRSDLDDRMRAWGRDQLVVTGVYGHIGVLATATDAFMRDLAPYVVGDALADFSLADHERTLAVARSVGAVVLGADDAVAALTAPSDATPAAWLPWLRDAVARALGDDGDAREIAARLVDDPAADVFEAGLDSLRCFALLDDLADVGLDVDFTDLVQHGSLGVVLDRITAAGLPAPAAAHA
ncbi:MAG TPA: isochorismatase family protein [Nocardioides sp.]